MEVAMSIQKVNKSFGGLKAVSNLDINIFKNQINALIGPNGAGKTTTINLITGSIPPDSGTIMLGDKDITGLREFEVARAGVRRTFQNLKLFGKMTALENVMMGEQGQDTSIISYIFRAVHANKMEKELCKKAEEVLEYLGLMHLRNKTVQDIPYGQQKKLEIARALVAKPIILLLDEPATGLNPTERAELVQLLYRIKNDGVTMLLIEHNMDVVMNISDWVTTLNFGMKIAEGTPDETKNNGTVIEAYLGSQFKKQHAL